jgi:RimJ/RimL family protein N-acetyltransferase
MMKVMGDQVTLRPVHEDDLPVMEKLTWDPAVAGEFAQFGWFDPQMWRRRWAENGLLGEDGGVLMVVRGDERLGFANWRSKPSTPATFRWEMGVAILPDARGHGHGTEAHRLLARYLFAHTTVHRIEAATEVGNVPSSGPWKRPDSPGKGCCAGLAGGTGRGGTASCTACCVLTWPADSGG